jgi:hypothetical protein
MLSERQCTAYFALLGRAKVATRNVVDQEAEDEGDDHRVARDGADAC